MKKSIKDSRGHETLKDTGLNILTRRVSFVLEEKLAYRVPQLLMLWVGISNLGWAQLGSSFDGPVEFIYVSANHLRASRLPHRGVGPTSPLSLIMQQVSHGSFPQRWLYISQEQQERSNFYLCGTFVVESLVKSSQMVNSRFKRGQKGLYLLMINKERAYGQFFRSKQIIKSSRINFWNLCKTCFFRQG